jgi:hypothetical protein
VRNHIFGHAYYTNYHLQTITFVIFFTGKKGLPRYSLAMGRTGNTTISRWPAWLGAAALLLTSFVAIATLSLQVRSGAEIVAVMFPPWWNSQQALLAAASANAAIVRLTALPAMLVVRPDAQEGLARLRHAGAWLAIDPQAIAACFNNAHGG